MIIPLSTDRPSRRPPLVTPLLLGANTLVFVVMLLVGVRSGIGVAEGAEPILRRFAFEWIPAEWWRWITYAFFHNPSDWGHLLGNMLFLWVFGPPVEDRFGRPGFAAFYLAGAALAATAHGLSSPSPLIGASGAIAAVTGAFFVLFPRTHVRVLIVFLVIGVFQFPAMGFVAFAVARDLLQLGMGDRVSHFAHLGGYAFGILVSAILLATRLLSREPYDLLSVFQHSRRRQDFKAAASLARDRDRRLRPAPSEPPPIPERALLARADVTARLAARDLPAAADAYRALLRDFPAAPGAHVLSRANQLALANHFFESGDHPLALAAYRAFAAAYPKDSQTPHVRLLVALIFARYLADPAAAKAELDAARPTLTDPEDLALADQLALESTTAPGTR